jgi:hypothetical protein
MNTTLHFTLTIFPSLTILIVLLRKITILQSKSLNVKMILITYYPLVYHIDIDLSDKIAFLAVGDKLKLI